MNSYWIDHHARQHVDELVADALGDRLVAQADVSAVTAPDRGTRSRPRPLSFLRAWLTARRARVARRRFASAK